MLKPKVSWQCLWLCWHTFWIPPVTSSSMKIWWCKHHYSSSLRIRDMWARRLKRERDRKDDESYSRRWGQSSSQNFHWGRWRYGRCSCPRPTALCSGWSEQSSWWGCCSRTSPDQSNAQTLSNNKNLRWASSTLTKRQTDPLSKALAPGKENKWLDIVKISLQLSSRGTTDK